MVNVHNGNYSAIQNICYDKYSEGKGKTKREHINNIFTFDIETSGGFLQKDGTVIPFEHDFWEQHYTSGGVVSKIIEYSKPISMMYIWQCAIENGNDIEVFIGRTWDEFRTFLTQLDDTIADLAIFGDQNISNCDYEYKSFMLSTRGFKRLMLHFYVHNLGYEMQFLRNIFPEIKNVFARSMRKPMKFEVKLQSCDITFHDTLCLTQKTLKKWGEDSKLSIQKAAGDLDYLIQRNSLTPLTDEEIGYCVNDVAMMIEGVQQYRDKYNGKLTNIPTTQTGEVRLVCQMEIATKNPEWAEKCYYIDHSYSWDFFNRLLQAFAGGWTHANERYSGQLQGSVSNPIVCWDFASSYPSVMTTCKFPVSEFRAIDAQRVEYLEKLSLDDSDYRFMIVVELYDVESKLWNSYFSYSKCIDIDEDSTILDNGKIVATDYMKVCITDTDWDIIRKAYDIGSYNILEAYEADAEYLPIEFINVILNYYEDKTALKGAGNESKYNAAKQFINSLYGCCVTKIITDEVDFGVGYGWDKHTVTVEDFEKLMEIPTKEQTLFNQISKKFTTYQIGVWIPAFARHRLWDAILQFDSKVVYCDTDSIKGHFNDEDVKWFEDYNHYIGSLQEKVANYYNFSVDRFSPCTPKGKKKQLGIFDREDDCVEFKALRAKVYAYKYFDNETQRYEIKTTIAGLPKKSGVKVIKNVDDLSDDLYWTPRFSDKLCCHYLDNQPEADWTDEHGNTVHCTDKYGIMLEPIGFDLSIASEYAYLLKVLNKHTDVDYFNTPEIIRNYWNGIDNDEE